MNSAKGTDEAVTAYVEGIDAGHRALFDRVHDLITAAHPDATVGISYQMPTYRVGRNRLYVGAWKHGISLYGWGEGRDGGFCERHPELLSGRGTIRLTPDAAAGISDDELGALVAGALSDGPD
ncbi:MAG: DUF1801 domain-containing protein [Acidimicrobiales bacterium]